MLLPVVGWQSRLADFCGGWFAVVHGGSASVLENEDKNEDERGTRKEERGTRNADEDRYKDENEDGRELQLHLAVLLQWLVCSDT